MRTKLLLVLCALLLAGCQTSGGEVSSQLEPAPPVKTAQELLEEQPFDEDHDAFLVDTGGRLGTLLVTAERGKDKFGWYPTTLSIWNLQKMDSPTQTIEIEVEGLSFGSHNVTDANFDGHQDFGYMRLMGVHSGSEVWYYWIWDEERGEFVEELGFEDIVSPWFDAEKETVVSLGDTWAGWGESKVYKWTDGHLVCMRQIEYDGEDAWAAPDKPAILTVKDRINGEMIEVFCMECALDTLDYFEERMKWIDLDYYGERDNLIE